MPVVQDFLTVRQTGASVINKLLQVPAASDRSQLALILEVTIVPVRGQHQMVSILRDVTEREQQREALDRIRAEALARSQEVISKQMRVAHEIASLLGETTAETKSS